jgi:hypothetical protein
MYFASSGSPLGGLRPIVVDASVRIHNTYANTNLGFEYVGIDRFNIVGMIANLNGENAL